MRGVFCYKTIVAIDSIDFMVFIDAIVTMVFIDFSIVGTRLLLRDWDRP